MIDLLFTLGAVAQSKTLEGARAKTAASAPALLPTRRFDDSQDCLTFLNRQVVGFGTLRVSFCCSGGTEQPVPWRSL